MNYDTSLQASFWVNIVLTTLGAVDMPGKGSRKMPSPRNYLATIVAWSVLQIGADAGYDRAASAVGWVIVLAGMVLGPFGQQVVKIFNAVAPSSSTSSTSPVPSTGFGSLTPNPPQGTTLTP